MISRAAVIAFVLLAAGSLPAFAAAAPEDILEALGKCASVADDKARLACYDAVSPRVKEAIAAPPAALPGNRPPTKDEQSSWFGFNLSGLFGSSPEQQTTPQQFGQEKTPDIHVKEDAAAQEIDSITAGVTNYAFTPFGKFIVFLDNGQVWQQIEGDAEHANFHKNPKDNKVTIERGFIGSYNLKVNDSDKVFKVTRMK
jgi:hypothetical protein